MGWWGREGNLLVLQRHASTVPLLPFLLLFFLPLPSTSFANSHSFHTISSVYCFDFSFYFPCLIIIFFIAYVSSSSTSRRLLLFSPSLNLLFFPTPPPPWPYLTPIRPLMPNKLLLTLPLSLIIPLFLSLISPRSSSSFLLNSFLLSFPSSSSLISFFPLLLLFSILPLPLFPSFSTPSLSSLPISLSPLPSSGLVSSFLYPFPHSLPPFPSLSPSQSSLLFSPFL